MREWCSHKGEDLWWKEREDQQGGEGHEGGDDSTARAVMKERRLIWLCKRDCSSAFLFYSVLKITENSICGIFFRLPASFVCSSCTIYSSPNSMLPYLTPKESWVVGEGRQRCKKPHNTMNIKSMRDKRVVSEWREKDFGEKILKTMKKSDHYYPKLSGNFSR